MSWAKKEERRRTVPKREEPAAEKGGDLHNIPNRPKPTALGEVVDPREEKKKSQIQVKWRVGRSVGGDLCMYTAERRMQEKAQAKPNNEQMVIPPRWTRRVGGCLWLVGPVGSLGTAPDVRDTLDCGDFCLV